MSKETATAKKRPTRLQTLREKGANAIPALPKRGAHSLDLNLLVEDPKNERKTFKNMEGLVDTVRSIGVIEPLTVVPTEDNRYMIVTGHRRFRAAKEVGLKRLRVVIVEPDNEIDRRQKSIVSNVQREDVPPVELAEALREILDESDDIKSQRDLAKMLGKRESWVSDMLRILSLPPTLQEKLRMSEVSVPYDAVMRISRLDEPKAQKALIENVLEGKSNRHIRESIKKIKKPETSKPQTPTVTKVKIETQLATVTLSFNKSNVTKQDKILALEQALESL